MKPVQAPIIIIKRPKAHHGHHGGAWKVAYADFVTAMMALFIVLWLTNTSEPVKKAVAGYFLDPTGTGKEVGASTSFSGEGMSIEKRNMEDLKEKIDQAMKQIPEFSKKFDKQVQVTVSGEGLRIELMENENGVFFETGSAKPSEKARELLRSVAGQLGAIPNQVQIEGHTDAQPFAGTGGYSNWELSADRANSARQFMQTHGLRADQVTQVRGYAAQKLKLPKEPTNPRNRRISIVVQYMDPPPAKAAPASGHKPTGEHKPAQEHKPAAEHKSGH